jgi:hypothetical protein
MFYAKKRSVFLNSLFKKSSKAALPGMFDSSMIANAGKAVQVEVLLMHVS